MNEFLENQLPAIITGILGMGAWIYEKRKKKAEVEEVETNVFKSMQSAYNTYANDSKEQYLEVMKRISELQLEVGRLQTESVTLKAQVSTLQEEVSHWKNKYNSLKREMDKNKK